MLSTFGFGMFAVCLFVSMASIPQMNYMENSICAHWLRWRKYISKQSHIIHNGVYVYTVASSVCMACYSAPCREKPIHDMWHTMSIQMKIHTF